MTEGLEGILNSLYCFLEIFFQTKPEGKYQSNNHMASPDVLNDQKKKLNAENNKKKKKKPTQT